MNPSTLSLILWIPFLLTVLVAGIIHCISGYRQGLWRALVRLGSVVVATLFSILLARLAAMLIAPPVASALEPMIEGADMMGGLLSALISGVISMVIAMLLFGLFMLFLPAIVRLICVKIWGDKLATQEKKLKLIGIGVGLVSAVLFAMLWTAPVYGTVATATPLLQTVVDIQEGEETQEISQYLEAVDGNLLVQTAKAGPVAWVYDGVAAMELDGAALPLTDMAESMSRLVKLLEQLSGVQDQATANGRILELVDLMQELIQKDWFYSVLQSVTENQELMADFESETMALLLPLLSGPKEEVKANLTAVLDMLQVIAEKDVLSLLENEEFDKFYEYDLIKKLGATVNATPRLAEMKKNLILGAIAGQLEMEAKDLAELLKDYPIDVLTDPAQQEKEAEVLLLALGVRPTGPAEMVARHPAMGIKAYNKLRETIKLSRLLGPDVANEKIDKLVKKKPKVENQIREALEQCAKLPLQDLSFLSPITTITGAAR